MVVPVVSEALGVVYGDIAWWLDMINPGHHNMQHLQKTVLFESTRILHIVVVSV